jgi:hypothetical protein
MNVRPDDWATKLFVGGIIAVAIVITAFALVGPKWGVFCLTLAVFEGWTLVNRYKSDTISEVIWEFAKRARATWATCSRCAALSPSGSSSDISSSANTARKVRNERFAVALVRDAHGGPVRIGGGDGPEAAPQRDARPREGALSWFVCVVVLLAALAEWDKHPTEAAILGAACVLALALIHRKGE